MVRPIAQISCWVAGELTEGKRPPAGFHANKSLQGKFRHHNSRSALDLSLFPGRTVAVGRDHHENDISINHPNVSRAHFIIYSVIYDLGDVQSQPPMIYVRDCQSLEGTYVGGKCIGNKEKGPSAGYYLSRDVEITIKPHWRFRVSLLDHYELKTPLNAIQLKESSLFKHRYNITERTLGSGAFASVYLAIDVTTGSQVACKIHDLDRLQNSHNSKKTVRRIMHETDFLGKLRHPNLPTFEYAFRSKHTLYTFTELATGGDLFSMRLVRGVFTERDCKFIVQQVINALRYLHQRGIAHRDLKPENILFAAGPDLMSRVILSDLGFAKSTASGRMASRVGTSQYMAPEVDYGRTHDLAVDIWSLGMIVQFLLTPEHVVTSCSLVEWNQVAINQWLDSIFEDPSQRGLSKHCQHFIRSCLMFEPTHRIKASEAKHHAWFQQLPDKGHFKFRMQENAKAWKPTHLIAPPVHELPDMKSAGHSAKGARRANTAGDPAAASKWGKRKPSGAGLGTEYSDISPYFTGLRPSASKRLKTTTLSQGNCQTGQKTKQIANTSELRRARSSSPDPLSQ
ncbi:kinase-like protein [Hypoxylon sp. FL1284]|nr:kinase-like protein [Hypoxylon sp. FL1284]